MKEIIKHKFSHLLFFLLLVSCFASAYGQERTITLNLSKVPLNTALKEIEKQTSMSVVYNTNDVDINRVISIKVTKESLNNVMNQLFRGVNVSFSTIKQQVNELITKGEFSIETLSVRLGRQMNDMTLRSAFRLKNERTGSL